MPGATGVGFSRLPVKATEEPREVIVARGATAGDELALDHSGSSEIGGKPGRTAAWGAPAAAGGGPRAEHPKEDAEGQQALPREGLWASRVRAGRCFWSSPGAVYLGRGRAQHRGCRAGEGGCCPGAEDGHHHGSLSAHPCWPPGSPAPLHMTQRPGFQAASQQRRQEKAVLKGCPEPRWEEILAGHVQSFWSRN